GRLIALYLRAMRPAILIVSSRVNYNSRRMYVRQGNTSEWTSSTLVRMHAIIRSEFDASVTSSRRSPRSSLGSPPRRSPSPACIEIQRRQPRTTAGTNSQSDLITSRYRLSRMPERSCNTQERWLKTLTKSVSGVMVPSNW
ncbi:hypothetical protein FOZ63_008961, partial [Perkinsus olseni]